MNLDRRIGAIGDDPDLLLTLVLSAPLDAGAKNELEELLEAWYTVGISGGYGGFLHNMSAIAYRESPAPAAEWTVDFGNAGELALTVLVQGLENVVSGSDCIAQQLTISRQRDAGPVMFD